MGKPSSCVVLGGGVSGLTTGIRLREAGHPTMIVAPAVAEATLSVVAGAIWGPFLAEPREAVKVWGEATLAVLRALSRDPLTGITVPSGLRATRRDEGPPVWSDQVDDFTECAVDELPRGFVRGWRFSAPVVDMTKYLPYLRARFLGSGGTIRERRVADISDVLAGASLIVNCTGIYSRKLVGDPSLTPVRGQIVVVKNPGITEFFVEQSDDSPEQVYWLPQGETVAVGGSVEPFDGPWSAGEPVLRPDSRVTESILRRCRAIEPAFEYTEVVSERVGLRPTRPAIRIELDSVGGVPLIHNYGHGGAGVSLSWGCAAAVVDLVGQVTPSRA